MWIKSILIWESRNVKAIQMQNTFSNTQNTQNHYHIWYFNTFQNFTTHYNI